MIRWPWTSRARLDDAFAEVAFLRQQNLDLIEHLRRVDRAAHGLTETVRAARPEIEPMPKDLDAYYDKLDNKPLAQELRRQAWRKRGQGVSWDNIRKDVVPTPESVELGAS